MKRFPFKKIDAFATGRSLGNPAGCIVLQDREDITRQQMQRIAWELKGFVSEVAYRFPSEEAGVDFELLYYSAEREVPFCGHATIATMYDTLVQSAQYRQQPTVTIATSKGTLSAENRLDAHDAVFIMAPAPEFLPLSLSVRHVAEALHIAEHLILTTSPFALVNAGLNTLIVPIRSLTDTLNIAPDLLKLGDFCIKRHIDIITVFTADVYDAEHGFRSRVFAPTFGYLEDPATGSGNAALGYYLLQHDYWDGAPLSLEQNNDAEHANIVRLDTRQDDQGQVRIMFGGGAVVRIEGEYLLQD